MKLHIKTKRLSIVWLAACFVFLLALNCADQESQSTQLQGLWNNQTDGFVRFGQDGVFTHYYWHDERDRSHDLKTLRERHRLHYRLSKSDPGTIEMSKNGTWDNIRTMRYWLQDGVLFLNKAAGRNRLKQFWRSFLHKASEAEKRFFHRRTNGRQDNIQISKELHQAVRQGNITRVEELLARGANPIIFTRSGEFSYDLPIDIAAHHENLGIMSALIDAGSPPPSLEELLREKKKSPARLTIERYNHDEVNSDKNLALILKNGWSDLAESLIDQGLWENNGKALRVAARDGRESIARRLLHLGGGFPSGFRIAAKEAESMGHADLAEMIRQEMDEAEKEIESRLGENYLLAAHNESRASKRLKGLTWTKHLAQQAETLISCGQRVDVDESEANEWSEHKFLFVDLANEWSESYIFTDELMDSLGGRIVSEWTSCLSGECESTRLVYSPEKSDLGCAIDICQSGKGNPFDYVAAVCLYGAEKLAG